ncbi:unnamed protein product [marine sediment metagenome]|uniref:Uncharacterized protein n=1 Tax=marine sediment metagenome TaxID=412755 RepID=X1NRL2_9ZZZZ
MKSVTIQADNFDKARRAIRENKGMLEEIQLDKQGIYLRK